MKKLLPFFLLVIVLIQLHCQNSRPQLFSRQIIEDFLVSSEDFKPVPPASDPFWQQTIPEKMRGNYIKLGYGYKGKQWDIIPDSVFSEYRKNGNRSNYQKRSFNVRRQMACLVMSEVMEHEGFFINDIIEGIEYFIEETWWGIPAHYPTDIPWANNQVVDLFNAETANLLAWTIFMLHDDLEEVKPGICDRLRNEIDRRFLSPARNNDYEWKTKVDNWNTWICSNWLSCILLCETDRNQQLYDIGLVLDCLEAFFKGYPNDGGCDEGVHYWDRAAASFFECIRILAIATNGKFTFSDNPKFRAMGSYVYKTYICDNSYVNFADALADTHVNINILYPYGYYIGDTVMTGFAAKIAEDANYKENPIQLFSRSGNFPTLSRELLFLLDYDNFNRCRPSEPLQRDYYLPDIQVFTARSFANSIDGLYVAAKGGHNAEKHNHNDIGSFIVYGDAEPLFIDIGFATYNSQTFSNKRYELINCRSAYHNVPLINGIEQHQGIQYRASNVEYEENDNTAILSLNIEKAYPHKAEVEKWKRTIILKRGSRIEITEDYKLNKYVAPSILCLICYGKPNVETPGRIALSVDSKPHYIIYDPHQLSPLIQNVRIDDPAINDTWSRKPIYRVCLTISNHNLSGIITYYIE